MNSKSSKSSKFTTVALSLVFLAGAPGCKKKGEDTKNPDNQEIKDASQAKVPDEEAKAQFNEVYAKYEEAKKDGTLSEGECTAIAKGFDEVYESNKASMLVARFNVGAVWEECGDMEKAVKVYEELGGKNFHLALNNLGVLEWNKGNTAKALDFFKKSVEADKKQAFCGPQQPRRCAPRSLRGQAQPRGLRHRREADPERPRRRYQQQDRLREPRAAVLRPRSAQGSLLPRALQPGRDPGAARARQGGQAERRHLEPQGPVVHAGQQPDRRAQGVQEGRRDRRRTTPTPTATSASSRFASATT